MKMTDAFLLARTKFKTRKIRSILTVIGAAFVVAIVLFLSFSLTGIKNSVKNSVSLFADENLLMVSEYTSPKNTDTTVDVTTKDYVKLRWESIAKEVGVDPSIATDFGVIVNVSDFGDVKIADTPSLTPTTDLNYVPSYGLRVADVIALDKYIVGSVTISDDEVGVLMPMPYLEALHESELSSLSDTQERVNKLKTLQETYLGKPIVLTSSTFADNPEKQGEAAATTTTTERKIKAKIIGFYPKTDGFISSLSGSNDYGGGYNFYTEINDFRKKHPEEKLNELVQSSALIIKIKDKAQEKQAKELINNHYKDSFEIQSNYYGDIGSNIAENGKSVRKIIFWIGSTMLVFVSIPMMGTMSKVLTDSTRESGVFRAIGARNSDMMYIYVLYSIMLSTAAFVVGFTIASSISILLTAHYGPSLGAELVGLSGSSTIRPVSLYGINSSHCLAVYGLLILAGIIGSILPIVRTLHKDPIIAMRDE